ncbi:MAG: SDR family oxidoreductase [Aggregatilineales bacterium]
MADMNGQVVLVTGATNGIGEVTAHELAKMGATVVIVGRSNEKTNRVQAEIKSATNNPNVDVIIADLSQLSEVRKVAETFKTNYDRLDVLVNNAGAVFTSYQQTDDGYEMTFALNHLNYFLLTNLLLDTLKASGTPEHQARIVNVASSAHFSATLSFPNVQKTADNFNGISAYNQSKLMNIMFTYALARRLEAEGAPVTTNALHPGLVSTGFARNNGFFAKLFVTLISPFAKNATDGAETQIYLASSPDVEGVSGKYFDNSKPVKSNDFSYRVEDQERLWTLSEEMVKLEGAAV